MNAFRYIFSFAALLALSAAPTQAAAPARDAYDNLAKAKVLLERENPANVRKNQNVVEKQLSEALANLELVNRNRGSALPLAKKAVQAAQAELARGNNPGIRARTLASVNEAMRQTLKAIDAAR